MSQFAMLSPQLIQKLKEVPPCARQLHQYLLAHYPAGRIHEINLDAYADLCGCGVKYMRTCFRRLVEKHIVEAVHRYSASEFKVIAHDDRTFDFAEGKKRVQEENNRVHEGNNRVQTEGSKPHAVVTKNKEVFRDNRDTRPLHPVNQEVEPGGNLVTPDISESKAVPEPVSRNFRQELENTLQQPLNKNILAVLLKYSEARARDALDALQEALAKGTVKNPAGWFIHAIRRGFKPNHARRSKPEVVPEAEPLRAEGDAKFQAWLEVALKAGVAIASGYNEQGELMVYGPDSAEPYEQACQTWPMQKLQQMLEAQEAIATPIPAPTSDVKPLQQPPEPSQKAPKGIDDQRLRSNALARLRAKWQLGMPKLRKEAIAEAKRWGFEIRDSGIFEVAF